MVASSTTGPVIVVNGATGAQGGSVISHLIRSDKPYQIHGVTRDTSKPASKALAEKGVTVVAADTDKREDLDRVFRGAEIIFAVTNYRAHFDPKKEIEDGKRIVDAAKAAQVKLLIWSSLEPVTKVSGGKLEDVLHFDSKAAVAEYAGMVGIPTTIVQAGFYMTNFHQIFPLRKLDDGSVVLALPVSPQTKAPYIDTASDYGADVVEAIESSEFGPGSEVLAASEELSFEELMKQFREVTGVKASYEQIPENEFLAARGEGGEEMLEMLKCFEQYGYFGPKDIAPSQRHLAAPVHTWCDYVRDAKWEVLV